MAAVTQIRHRHSQGRAYYDKKLAEGKTPKEALRSLKRQVSNAIFACLQADARRAAARAKGPGGQQGNDSVASAAGSHPRHRLFGQATPGPGHHPTATASSPAPGPARGTAGHSPVAATPPPATPQVQAERPQRSEDERPAGAPRRRPHPAARKAKAKGPLITPQRPKGTSHPAKRPMEILDTKRLSICAGVGSRAVRVSGRRIWVFCALGAGSCARCVYEERDPILDVLLTCRVYYRDFQPVAADSEIGR
jgi:hypothetical protein